MSAIRGWMYIWLQEGEMFHYFWRPNIIVQQALRASSAYGGRMGYTASRDFVESYFSSGLLPDDGV